MKLFFKLTIFLFGWLLFSCQSNVESPKQVSKVSKPNSIEVLDFYGTHRCVTCQAIESNTQSILETHFKDALADKRITFYTINVDDEKYLDVVEKYQATGTALFMNVIKNGEETHTDLTALGFSKGRDIDAFTEALVPIIETELNNL